MEEVKMEEVLQVIEGDVLDTEAEIRCCHKVECGDRMRPDGACVDVFHQTHTISVPVEVSPYAKVGTTSTVCCGSAVITPGHICQGECNYTCEFTITRKICVEIPIEFGADIETSHPRVQCGNVFKHGCDCKKA